ncbi:hypothetical protein HCN44_000080 [Aphidius gifuensis]|uniref:Peptidase M12B domain-containing protein n=1 Tax=Aphidius gifuensis TaxID=684658 RepID=A0A835CRJ3_APHGI|nr:hypothetical protein HCN44_000080 [Aphidius gifuensis]
MAHGFDFGSILYRGNEKPEIRCKKLWCVDERSSEIETNGSPINDGTPCGDEKICFKGMCSDYWGPWKPLGNCSDGIRRMIRHFYKSDPCRLYCYFDGEPKDSVDFGTVIDGTHCLSDSAHHCIKGRCKHMSLVPYNKTEQLSASKSIPLLTTNKRELNLTTQKSILTQYYSRPYYIRIGVFVDWTMVDYHQENLTTYIEMMMAKVTEVYKHPSIGHSIEIVLTDIIVITIEEYRSFFNKRKPKLSLEKFSKWVKQKQTYINNFDIPIYITRKPHGSFYDGWRKEPIWGSTDGNLCGPLSPSILVKDNGVYLSHTLTYEIGRALGMPDDAHPLCKNHETKTTMNHPYTAEYPLTWSECSREFITNCLNSDRAISLREKPKEYIHSSQQQLPGEIYTLDQQCEKTTDEISIYRHESTKNLSTGCKSFSCKALNSSYPVENIKHPLFDGTSCGPGQMCLDGSCVDKKTYPRLPIHGGWSDWKVGRCSTACGAGIRKYTRHCNNPMPAYGGNYCLGRRIRFEYCNIKECNNKTVDLRKKKCSELNNVFKNFTAVYDLNDRAKICKLTCQEIGNSTNVVDHGTVMDGTPCGNDTDSTDDMCINGECKKIGCNINDDMNEEYGATDICNITTKYCKVPDPATGQISNDSLCYEMLPESWTVNNIHIVINRIEQRWDKAIEYWNNEKFQLMETINRANKNISGFIYNLTKLEMKTHQGCKELWCVENDSPEIITNGAPINDGTQCGDAKICMKGMCSDYWGPWMPAGNCSDGIRKMIRHFYRSDPCRLYCIDYKNPKDLVDFGTVIDGTHCLSDSAHHCMRGQCKHMSLVPYNETKNLSSSKSISLSTTNKRELNFTSKKSILTKYYSRPYHIRIGVFVDWTMVDYHKENLTTYIEMMMAKVTKGFKHPSIGHSIEIVLTDIIVITIKEWQSLIGKAPGLSPENFSKWVKQKQTHINNFDIPIHITRNPNSSLYGIWAKAPIGNFTHGSLCGPLSPSILVKDNGVYLSHTLTYQIGQALGVPDDSHPLCEIHETKTTMNHAYTVEYPLTWSDCSRKFITNCLNSDRAISLREKPNEYIHSSQQLLPGKVYSLDQQCQKTTNEESFYHYESTENLNIGCKSFSCKRLNNSYPIENVKHPMFDGTPCGPGQICLDGSCVDKKSYPRSPIHGGWSDWKVGKCSTACGAGIRKYTRHCNNPMPAYGGDYCLGRRIRFEYCNIKECSHEKVDLRKKKCSELNNVFKNFTAVYDLNVRAKICKLTCQEIGNSTNVVDYGTVMDGTPCGNDTDSTDDMCINGECKKIGCNINDDINEEYGATDICNVSTKYCKVPDPATGQISNDNLCYEMLPELWTANNIHIVINRIEQRWDKAIEYWNNEKFQLMETINRVNKNISEFIYDSTKLEIKFRQVLVDDLKALKNQTIINQQQKRKILDYEITEKMFPSKIFQEYIYNYTLQQQSINKSIEDKIYLRTVNINTYIRYC